MKHIVSFSTGVPSAITAERVIKRHGRENVTIVFMDTLNEDADNYRFKYELISKRWSDIDMVDLSEGRSPRQTAIDENMIFNQRRHPCTRILKIEPFMSWLAKQPDNTVHIGIDWSETHRCTAIKRNYEKAGYKVDFPLLWKPLITENYHDIARYQWGIEPPQMYKLGFSHANCGDSGCFQWGIGDWIRYLLWKPEKFNEMEAWEKEMRIKVGDYAICRDQSNGEVKPRTLESIRLEYQSTPQLSIFDSRSGCVSCGIGDFLNDTQPPADAHTD